MHAETLERLQREIASSAEATTDPADRTVSVLKDAQATALAAAFDCRLHQVYAAALDQNIWPFRYVRNRQIISAAEQLKLAEATVAVVGAGGLGGTVILLLARMGIGHLKVVDGDVFDETNLNRQALSSVDNLGTPKVEAAVEVVAAVNPGVRLTALRETIDRQSARQIFGGVDVVVDALDNAPDRLAAAAAAREIGIPFVHGALAGFDAQVMTIFPQDTGLKLLYGEKTQKDDPQRPEAVLGVPAITPSLVASLQAMEVLKILLQRGESLRNRLLHVDLESSRFDVFSF
jgi:molybdopterin/thiamine biosynthesis adenylyltransferase